MTWWGLTRSGWLVIGLMAGSTVRAVGQQHAGTVEIGLYAQINSFDESLRLDNVTGMTFPEMFRILETPSIACSSLPSSLVSASIIRLPMLAPS